MTDWQNLSCLGSVPLSTRGRLIVAIPVLILSVISTFFNISLCYIIHNKTCMDVNFSRHLYSMIAASLGYLSVNFYLFLPIAFFGLQVSDPWMIIFATPNSFFFQTIEYINTALALDRCIVFLFTECHRRLMETRYLKYVLIVVPWMLSTFIVLHSSFLGYYKRINPFTLSYTYDCSDGGGGIYPGLLYYLGFVLPAVIFVLYMIILAKLYVHRKTVSINLLRNNSSQLNELLLLIQFSIISLVQLFGATFFTLGPSALGDLDATSLFRTFFSMLNTLTNPIVMLVFQRKIRQQYIELVAGKCCKERWGSSADSGRAPLAFRYTTTFK